MIEMVVSGGQTGADQAGWHAAKAAGIPTGGWMPKGFLTEAGNHPEFAEIYGARAHQSSDYRERTIANMGMATLTLLFGNPHSPGSRLVLRIAGERCLFVFPIRSMANPTPETTVRFIRQLPSPWTINVAGNRESSSPGIGRRVEKYLTEVFRLIREEDRP